MTTKPLLRFAKAPPLGVAIEHDDQVFEVITSEPYTNRRGEETGLLTWRTGCRVCGGAVEFKTGWSIYAFGKRCDDHKLRNPVDRLEAAKERAIAGGKG